jgi:probable F420-dependent oxidoreductase
MQLGVALPNLGPLADRSLMVQAVARAEGSGLADVWLGDHVAYPLTVPFPHPSYRGFAMRGDAPILDPLAMLAFVAARTERLRIGTSVLIVPYRHPVLTARMVATIDHLSAGRVIFGAGSGWFDEEFAVLGADFARRGLVTDEYLRLMRALWSQDSVDFDGATCAVRDLGLRPRPAAGLPVWIGGESPAAVRRARDLGDGWQPMNPDPAEFATHAAALRAVRGAGFTLSVRLIWGGPASDRTTGPAGLPADPDLLLDVLRTFAGLGADHALLTLRASTPPEYLGLLERVCTEVVPVLPGASSA